MADSTPDLTGGNSAYSVTGELFAIFMTPQVISFDTPVYLSSISISVVGLVVVPLVQNTDWEINTESFTAESQMKVLEPSFTQTLVSSIKITKSLSQPYQITCNYQRLYQDQTALLQARVTSLETRLAALTSSTASTPSAPKLLSRDPNETNSANVITAESYVLNTFSGQNLIIPASGSFFADSVVLTLPTNPVTTLVRNTDYVIINLDVERTKETPNTSGVYRSILMTRPYAGNVLVSYHAFGGSVTLSDVRLIYQMVTNISNYLGGNGFLTQTTLGTDIVITDIIARIAALEATTVDAGGVTSASFNSYITTWANSLDTSNPGVPYEWYLDSGLLTQVPPS